MLANRLGEFSSNLIVENLSSEVIHSAKRSILDWFSAVVPGGLEKPARLITKSLIEEIGLGPSTLIPIGTLATPRLAALINGTAAHTLEVDDIYREGIYHPGPPVIAASLAISQAKKLSGNELIASVISGYEVSNRIAAAIQPDHYDYWHTTGTVGSFGAAIGASRALNLPSEKTIHAIANSATLAAGLQQALRSNAMSKVLHAGRAAETGLLCALMAEQGVTGAKNMIEGELGFGNAMGKNVNWDLAFNGLGKNFTITRMTQKNHFCCGHNFAAIDGVLEICKKQNIKPDQIKKIRVGTYKKVLEVCGNRRPESSYEAKFSLPYTVAIACFLGSVRLAAFSQDWFEDDRVWKLMESVEAYVDDRAELNFPGKRSAFVEIEIENATAFTCDVPTRIGDPDEPLNDFQLEHKFIELVEPVIGEEEARNLITSIWGLEDISDVNEICKIANQYPRE